MTKSSEHCDHGKPTCRAGTLALVGCELAFDFTNTTSGRGGDRHIEHLNTADDVVVWAHHANIISRQSVRLLQRLFARSPRLSRDMQLRALGLRDTIYRIGTALAAGRPPPSLDLNQLAHSHAECLRSAHLRRFSGAYVWAWDAGRDPVEAVLGPIALSALTLLSQADLSRVKQCPGRDCGWLFFDITKNKSRRWCEMEVCGNRAKQKRLRQKRYRES